MGIDHWLVSMDARVKPAHDEEKSDSVRTEAL
jgi:hypothetical protein